MSTHPDERTAEMRDLFFQGAQELLESLNDQGLRLETEGDNGEIIREIRRTVHTLKGDAAAVGFRELSELAHEVEDVLAPTAISNWSALANVVLSAADMFDAMLAAYRAGLEPPSGDPLRALIRKMDSGSRVPAHGSTSGGREFMWSEYERLAIARTTERGLKVFNVALGLATDCPMRSAASALIQKTLQEAGEVVVCSPEQERWATADKIEIALASSRDACSISEKLRVPGVVATVVVEEVKIARASALCAPEAPAARNKPTPAANRVPSPSEQVLRIDAERVDNILNLIGEMVIGKSMLHQAVQDFAQHNPKDPLNGRLSDVVAFQSQVLNALQHAAMKVRMVPVEQLFHRFPRLVRDVAQRSGKNVTLDIAGQDTDLDKALLDAVAEPLAHMVRNAVDHGIETAADRRACGKPEQGLVRLNAFHQGNQVVIEVSDDGRGIDAALVLTHAVERGLVTADQAARLSPSEALNFIFEPGFSTAGEVTEISGRGIGMDAVKAAVQRLKGTVNVDTAPGRGTRFQIRLPLTLAILRCMLFHVGEQLYAIPLDTIIEITRTTEPEISRVEDREVLQLRNEVLTIVRLNRLEAPPAVVSSKLFVIVASVARRKYGLVVDSLVGEEELVIKPLDSRIVPSEVVSGASVLGDGSVAMILNIHEVVRRFAVAELPGPPPASPGSGMGATA